MPDYYFNYFFICQFFCISSCACILYRYETFDVKRTLAEQPDPENKPVMTIPERIANLQKLHAYFSKVVSVAVPIANYCYYFFKLFFRRF